MPFQTYQKGKKCNVNQPKLEVNNKFIWSSHNINAFCKKLAGKPDSRVRHKAVPPFHATVGHHHV